MAANLDKAESSLTTVSDLSYIRGIDSSGNSVKISKSDLASVLGVMTLAGGSNDADLAPAGYSYLGTGSLNLPPDNYSAFVFTIRHSSYTEHSLQILWAYETHKYYIRAKAGEQGWETWKEL